jgi:hypothetical protein
MSFAPRTNPYNHNFLTGFSICTSHLKCHLNLTKKLSYNNVRSTDTSCSVCFVAISKSQSIQNLLFTVIVGTWRDWHWCLWSCGRVEFVMDINRFLLLLRWHLLLCLVQIGCIVNGGWGAFNLDWNYPCLGLINSCLLLGLWLGWLNWLNRLTSSLNLQDDVRLIVHTDIYQLRQDIQKLVPWNSTSLTDKFIGIKLKI